jgi:quercetin dioxygenase-like cupin family protein
MSSNSLRLILALTVAALPVVLKADEPVPMQRLTPSEIEARTPATGSGPRMTSLLGDPTKAGLYTVRVSIPAHTQVRPHTHRDNRAVTVLSGTWHMGYGTTFDPKALKDLPPGSFYTEPAGQPHFAQTEDEPVVILVTGYGPSDTQFVASDKR